MRYRNWGFPAFWPLDAVFFINYRMESIPMKFTLFLLFIPFIAQAYIPTHNAQEFRVIVDVDTYALEGQMASKKILNSNIKVSGVFKLGEEESKMGASLSYKLNKYTFITVAGDINHKRILGGAVWINTVHHLPDNIVIIPFLSIEKKEIGVIGLLIYKEIMGVDIHIGFRVAPLSTEGINAQIILGTVLIGDAIETLLGG